MVVVEQATETPAPHYFTVARRVFRLDDLVVEALMRTLSVVMGKVLGDHASDLSADGHEEASD